MFKKSKPKKHKATHRIDTLIGRRTQITGDIGFTGGIRIDGSITGNIHVTGDDNALLTLSEHGLIEGEVRVPNLIINGIVNGNVYASHHVELAAKARINGNLYYRYIEMAMGAEVNGHLIRASEENADFLHVEHEVFDQNTNLHLEQKA